MTSLAPSKLTKIPVSTGRLSSREADLLTRPMVESSTSASTFWSADGADVRELREVLGRVGVNAVAGRAARDQQHRLVRKMLERHVGFRQRPRDVDQEPAGHDHAAVAGDVGGDRGAQRELHVGRGELEVAVFGVETHAAEHEDGRAGRERTGNDGHAVGEGVAGDRCFQHIHDHGF